MGSGRFFGAAKECEAPSQPKSVFRVSQQSADFLAGIPDDLKAVDMPDPKRHRADAGAPPLVDAEDHGSRHGELDHETCRDSGRPDASDSGDVVVFERPSVEVKVLSDAVPMTVGFGPNGVSVQVFKPGQGSAWKTDREIVQYTALRGKQEVKCGEVCHNLRHNVLCGGRTKRQALPQDVWDEVMKAGLLQYPVGRLVDVGTKSSRVFWNVPPSPEDGRDAMAVWHNHWMDLCGMSGRDARKLLAKASAA